MSKFFSKRLYTEGLARVRTPGIVAAVLTLVFSVITPLNQLLDELINKPAAGIAVKVMNATDLMNPLLVLLFAIPFFALTSFGFLNKRHSSDFYHALPYTRVSIFLSFLSGILTWICGIAFVSMSLRALFYALHPQIVVDFGSVMLGTFSYVVGAAVLLGYLVLALSLTGTRFSNVAVFFILFALPRYFMGIFLELLGSLVPMIDVSSHPYAWLSGEYSLVRIVFSNFISVNARFLNIWIILLHLFYALGLFALGAWVFHKRKSETAGNPATCRLLQHIWRLAAATPFALLAVSTTVETLSEEMESPAVAIIAGLFFLFLSALTYIFYELLSTGKLKRFGKMMQWFLFLLLPMALLVAMVFGVKAIVLHRDIALEDIESVTFVSGYGYGYDQPWEELQTANLAITDASIIEIVHRNYEETLSVSVKGEYKQALRQMGEDDRIVNLKITSKNGKTRTYNLFFTAEEYEYVGRRKMEIAEYREAYLSLPTAKNVNYFLINGVYCQDTSVYAAFASAYENLSDAEKTVLKDNYAGNAAFELYVQGSYDSAGREFYARYAVPADMETLIFALRKGVSELSWEGESKAFSTNAQAAKYLAETILDGVEEEDYFYIEITLVSSEKIREIFYHSDDYLEKESPTLQSISREVLSDVGDMSSPHYIVVCFGADIDGNYESFITTLSISEELAAQLLALDSAYE